MAVGLWSTRWREKQKKGWLSLWISASAVFVTVPAVGVVKKRRRKRSPPNPAVVMTGAPLTFVTCRTIVMGVAGGWVRLGGGAGERCGAWAGGGARPEEARWVPRRPPPPRP